MTVGESGVTLGHIDNLPLKSVNHPSALNLPTRLNIPQTPSELEMGMIHSGRVPSSMTDRLTT